MSADSNPDWEEWFLGVWEDREERVYRQLFGDIGAKIHTIPAALFHNLGEKEIDPRWTTHGVFECSPCGARTHFTYVTSALSNPWGIRPEQARVSEPSGLGFELVLETPEQARWAVTTLHWLMAIQILAASGKLKGEMVFVGARVPLFTSINPQNPESLIRNLLIAEPVHYPKRFPLASGYVDLFQCVGLTDSEMEFCRDRDTGELTGIMRENTNYPITDDKRGNCAK